MRIQVAMIEYEPRLLLGVGPHCRRIGPRAEASPQPMGKVYRTCRGEHGSCKR